MYWELSKDQHLCWEETELEHKGFQNLETSSDIARSEKKNFDEIEFIKLSVTWVGFE